jgi:anti-sigma regulatory factor (Ser/Thr protein kinase)
VKIPRFGLVRWGQKNIMTRHLPGHSVNITLASTARAPREARDALRRLGPDLPLDVLDDATLLVSELVTNSVRHAASGAGSRIRLRIDQLPGGVRVEVADWGPGFTVQTARPRDDGGFGLLLVRQIATRWGIERDDTTRVWFEIERSPGGLPAAC